MPSKPKTPAVPPDSWYGAVRAWLPTAPELFKIEDVMHAALRGVRATDNSLRVDLLVCARVLRGLGCVKVHTSRGKRWARREWATYRRSQRCYMPVGPEAKKHKRGVNATRRTRYAEEPMWVFWVDAIRDWLSHAPDTFSTEDVFRGALRAGQDVDFGRSEAVRVGRCLSHLGLRSKSNGKRRVYTKPEHNTDDRPSSVSLSETQIDDRTDSVSLSETQIDDRTDSVNPRETRTESRQREKKCAEVVLTAL